MIGVRGVAGRGDVGVGVEDVVVGETISNGGGFRFELRFGLGGAPPSLLLLLLLLGTPNSDVGSEYREAAGVAEEKWFVGSDVSNVGISGDGGSDSCSVAGLLPAVWLRRGGGNDGRRSLGVCAVSPPRERVRLRLRLGSFSFSFFGTVVSVTSVVNLDSSPGDMIG